MLFSSPSVFQLSMIYTPFRGFWSTKSLYNKDRIVQFIFYGGHRLEFKIMIYLGDQEMAKRNQLVEKKMVTFLFRDMAFILM